MSELPYGWSEPAIDDLRSIEPNSITDGPYGSNLKSSHYTASGPVVVRLGNIGSRRYIDDDRAHISPEHFASLQKHRVFGGDIVVAALGDPLGRACLIPSALGAALVKADCFRFRPSPEVDANYLTLWLNSEDARSKFFAASHGLGRVRINLSDFRSVRAPLAPLPEQRRIVAKVDSLSAKSRRARDHLEHIPRLVEKYKQAILAAAFRGELTHGGVKHPFNEQERTWSVPDTWTWSTVAEIGEVSLGRQRSPKDHAGPQMRRYVRAANITWSGLKLDDVKEMNFDDREFVRFKLTPGDVLLNEGSGSAKEVGKPAIWRGEIENCCFQNTILRVRPSACSSEFLYWYFLFCALTEQFVSRTQGVNIYHIGKEGLASFPIPLPPKVDQDEIVQRIERAFTWIDRLASEATGARKLIDNLDQAILAKAFRGELVPQDPNDEPASVLLERIRTERAAVDVKRKPKERPKASAKQQ